MGSNNWKVGDKLVYEGLYTMGCTTIERETNTQYILANKDRIKKGENRPLGYKGEHGCPYYYLLSEEAGQKIYNKIVKRKKLNQIEKIKWEELPVETLDAVLKVLEG